MLPDIKEGIPLNDVSFEQSTTHGLVCNELVELEKSLLQRFRKYLSSPPPESAGFLLHTILVTYAPLVVEYFMRAGGDDE